MRVTFNSGFTNALHAINGAAQRLEERQREVATGRKIHVPSDNPSATAAVIAEKTEMGVLDRFVRLERSRNTPGSGLGLAIVRSIAERHGGFGGANADMMTAALEVINFDQNVRSILINIFGGITRGEEVANGIVEALRRVELRAPIVIRLDGTNAEEGREILAVIRGSRAERPPVHLGLTSFDRVEVVDGLQEGDEVILTDTTAYAKAREIEVR